MRPTAKFMFWSIAFLWAAIMLPFFIPGLNSLLPVVLGLPFVVFLQYLLIGLHLALCVYGRYYVWDAFDKKQNDEG